MIDFLVDNNLLPLTSFVIEPAKVLFLNNAINHGILTPLGTAEAAETGKSVLFLLEANPGPGLGLLLAFTFFGKGMAKASAPGAILIHFFGGIHEIYFPYVLMKPKLILADDRRRLHPDPDQRDLRRRAACPGRARVDLRGLRRDHPPADYLGVTLSILGGAAASFVVAAFMLKADTAEEPRTSSSARPPDGGTEGQELLGRLGAHRRRRRGRGRPADPLDGVRLRRRHGVLGDGRLGAAPKIEEAGHHDVTVVNKAIANLTDEYDLVVSHQDLTPRAKQQTPSAIHVSVDNFMGSPRYDEIVELVDHANAGGPAADPKVPSAAPVEDAGVLGHDSIVLHGSATTKDAAITRPDSSWSRPVRWTPAT